ncbi:unnamed protein product [Lota lota]
MDEAWDHRAENASNTHGDMEEDPRQKRTSQRHTTSTVPRHQKDAFTSPHLASALNKLNKTGTKRRQHEGTEYG